MIRKTNFTIRAKAYVSDDTYVSWMEAIRSDENFGDGNVVDELSVEYPTGCSMVVQLVGEGSRGGAYVNAVLFGPNGHEVACDEPAYEICGGILHDPGETDGIRYVLELNTESVEPRREESHPLDVEFT